MRRDAHHFLGIIALLILSISLVAKLTLQEWSAANEPIHRATPAAQPSPTIDQVEQDAAAQRAATMRSD